MQLSREELKLQSLVEYFYAIPGVPSKAVKPEQLILDHHKIFIQSTSQGSRCLKKGEKLLYHKEVHYSYNACIPELCKYNILICIVTLHCCTYVIAYTYMDNW